MTRLLPLALLLVACGEPDDSTSGIRTKGPVNSAEGSCVVVSETELAVDEQAPTPLNFSAQQALNELAGGTNEINTLFWPDQMSTSVNVVFAHDGGAPTMVVRETQGILSQQELVRCFTALEIPGTLTFTTGDGAFTETFDVILKAKDRKDAAFYIEVSQGSLVGSWTPTTSGLDAGLTGLTMVFDGEMTSLGSDGLIKGVEASGTEHEVATWAPPPTQG